MASEVDSHVGGAAGDELPMQAPRHDDVVVSVLLVADVHLDRPFAWAPPEVARRRRRNLRGALARAVAVADERGVDVLAIAGDLYEDAYVTPDTVAFLTESLSGAGRPVLLAPGNHDPHTATSVYATATWGADVHVFDRPVLTPWDGHPRVRFWGAAHLAHAGTAGFLADASVAADGLHLALFHGAEGGVTPTGRVDPHAPFTAGQVPAAGFAHALVGHHHAPVDGRWHTYPGNPDPLGFGETGPRGAVEIALHDDGSVVRTRHDVSVSRVADVVVDVSGATSSSEVRSRVAASLPDAEEVRVTLTGELGRDVALDPGGLADLGGATTVVARLGGLHVAADVMSLRDERTVRGEFVRRVLAADDLDEVARRRVLATGLRALDGRSDLEVPA